MGKEKANTGAEEQRDDQRSEIVLDRRTIDSIKTYEITEDQLVMIESGTSSNELNFSIALLSAFSTLVVALVITEIHGTGRLVFVWVATLITGILGLYFALEYRKKRRSSSNIFERIRGQKSTRAIRDNTAAFDPVTEPSDEQSDNAS